MDSNHVRDLMEAYISIYAENQEVEQLDEVTGRGRIDPVSDFPHHGERARSPKDAGLIMSPLDRAVARENALRKRNDREATRRANRIQSRFIGPTKRGIGRAIDAANIARTAEKKRLMDPDPDPQESYEYDFFDCILEYLVAEGYADTNENALVIMANMSEEWRQDIVEAVQIPPIGKPQKYMSSSSTPRPDRSSPQDRINAQRIKNTPLGARLTSPGGPVRNPRPATGPNGFLNR